MTISLDAGGSRAGRTFGPVYRELNELLAHECQDRYSDEIDRLCPVLRVSGEVADFAFRGFAALRRNRRTRVVTFDVGILREDWEDKGPAEIRGSLLQILREATRAAVVAIEGRGSLREMKVVELLDRVGTRFLADEQPQPHR